MANEFTDRREFLRYDYDRQLNYKTIKTPKVYHSSGDALRAITKNLSASGLLFVANTKDVPDISSLLAIDLDFHTANVCREIERLAVMKDNKLIGKVVRIEANDDGTCGVGVAFIKKSDHIDKTVEELLK